MADSRLSDPQLHRGFRAGDRDFDRGFAEASDLFRTRPSALQSLLFGVTKGIDLLPKIVTSKLHNTAGILGGARVAFDRFAP